MNSSTPPPPYGAHSESDVACRASPLEETIPKSRESGVPHYDGKIPMSPGAISDRSTQPHKLQDQTDQFGPQPTCCVMRRSSHSEQQAQFINAMSAPKKFFNFVTVEPLAFLAILAIYIEFPSIQDLIYTKICLQVVSDLPHINQTQQFVTPRPLISHSITRSRLNETLNNQSIVSQNFNREPQKSLSNGRIGQQVDAVTAPPNLLQSNDHQALSGLSKGDVRQLCDRMNRTAIPLKIRQEIIEEDSLFWLKYQLIICSVCALSCPYWGGMSDKINRLIPLNVPIIVSVLSNTLSLIFGFLISLNSHDSLSVDWLFLGAVMVGLSGGQAVVIVGSFSFISDNTSSESRSVRVAILESVIYLSHSVGFLLTKFIMKLGLATPEQIWLNRHFVAFGLCVLLNIICVIYSTLKLRHQRFHRILNNFERNQQEAFAGESISTGTAALRGNLSGSDCATSGAVSSNHERLRELTASTPDDLDGPIVRADRSWSSWGTVLLFNYYKETYTTTTKKRESRNVIILILLCGFISAMSLSILMSLLFIYLRTEPFEWTTSQYSSWNFITSITRGVALVCLTIGMKFMKNWNIPDPIVAAVGFLSKGIGLTMIALAQSTDIVNWSLLAFVMSEYSMPPIRSLLSKLVVREEVAKIYSCLAAMQSICFMMGSIILYFAYTSLKLQSFFRLSFFVVAGFQFLAVIIMLSIYTKLRRRVIVV